MVRKKFDRRLALIVVAVLGLLGLAELIARLDELPLLLFWLPTLWGGAACIFVGCFGIENRPVLAKSLVIIGGVLAIVPTMWTLVVPLGIVTLIVRVSIAAAPQESVE